VLELLFQVQLSHVNRRNGLARFVLFMAGAIPQAVEYETVWGEAILAATSSGVVGVEGGLPVVSLAWLALRALNKKHSLLFNIPDPRPHAVFPSGSSNQSCFYGMRGRTMWEGWPAS
jgi:hypothetical protein